MSQNDRNEQPLRSQSRPSNPSRHLGRSRNGARPARARSPHQAREQVGSRRQAFESFARSVSCLLNPGDPSATDRQALVTLVRRSFPDYLRAKASLTAAQERQQKQVGRLGPHLLTNASCLAEPNPEESGKNKAIDESARILWELARIDEQIETLAQRINLLQHQIITWVKWDEPANTRAVRWALENA